MARRSTPPWRLRPLRRPEKENEPRVFGRAMTPAFPKRSPLAGTMDEVRPQTAPWRTRPRATRLAGLILILFHHVAATRRPRTEEWTGEGTTQKKGLTRQGPLQKSGFRSYSVVSRGCEIVCAFFWRVKVDDAPNGGPEAVDGSLRGFSQQRLQFGEGVLNRIEVRTIGRKIKKLCARRLDDCADGGSFVAGQIIHDDDVSGRQFWRENFLDVKFERVAIDWSVENEGSDDAAGPKPRHDCRRFPMMGWTPPGRH